MNILQTGLSPLIFMNDDQNWSAASPPTKGSLDLGPRSGPAKTRQQSRSNLFRLISSGWKPPTFAQKKGTSDVWRSRTGSAKRTCHAPEGGHQWGWELRKCFQKKAWLVRFADPKQNRRLREIITKSPTFPGSAKRTKLFGSSQKGLRLWRSQLGQSKIFDNDY